MAFRQTYKGIFQFEDQEALERAMAENQAEALGADAMGLQDSFHGNGVMFLNIDARAEEADWEEMAVAIATLAMHASKGFVYAYADREDGNPPEIEYYEANGGGSTPTPSNTPEAPSLDNDYFPMREGSHFVFRSNKDPEKVFDWTTHTYTAQGREYFYWKDTGHNNVHFNDYWDGTFYYKDKSLIGTVAVGTEAELDALSLTDPYASQIIYNSQGQPGDMLYSIWNQDNVLVLLTQEDFQEVSTPYGDHGPCMVLRVEMYRIKEDSLDVHMHTQYFAKGIGLVKWEIKDEALELVEVSLGAS